MNKTLSVAHTEIPLREKAITLALVVVPFLACIVAVWLLRGRGFTYVDLGLLVGFYFLTGLGVTIGFHRCLTHHSFKTYRPIKVALAIFGSMAAEGPVFLWCEWHRTHHKHSDKELDPHSPHTKTGRLRVVRGFIHAHVAWLFRTSARNDFGQIKDLTSDPALVLVNRLFPLWVILSLALPTLLGGLMTLSFKGAFFGFLWGGLVRMFILHHVTWCINSVCHMWGSRPYETGDKSTNNLLLAVVGFGEGNHRNHHKYQWSARHGLRWWQPDLSWYVIWALGKLKLAWDIKIPERAMVLSTV